MKNSLRVSILLLSISVILNILGTASEANQEYTINNFSRESITTSYQDILEPLLEIPVGWTGNSQECRKGSTSSASQEATIAALNYVRALMQLKPVSLNPTMSSYAQASALISAANGRLTHTPTTRMLCYSKAGYLGSSRGNLGLTPGSANSGDLALSTGPRAVLQYMKDNGDNNKVVGHRRWLSYSKLTEVGVGDTNVSNTITVIGGKLSTSPNQWLMWPMQGYFPRELEPDGRWSISYPGADFRFARISVRTPNGAPRIRKSNVKNGLGDNTLAWDMKLPEDYSKNVRDYKVLVNVSRIKVNGKWVSKSYIVNLITSSKSKVFTESNQTADSSTQGNAGPLNNSHTSIDQPESTKNEIKFTPMDLKDYIRPQVSLIGVTSCTKSNEAWLITLTWEVNRGNYYGLHNGNHSGLKNYQDSWLISSQSEWILDDIPTGEYEFVTEGEILEFLSMNQQWETIDVYRFDKYTISDVTGRCQ